MFLVSTRITHLCTVPDSNISHIWQLVRQGVNQDLSTFVQVDNVCQMLAHVSEMLVSRLAMSSWRRHRRFAVARWVLRNCQKVDRLFAISDASDLFSLTIFEKSSNSWCWIQFRSIRPHHFQWFLWSQKPVSEWSVPYFKMISFLLSKRRVTRSLPSEASEYEDSKITSES